MDYKTLAEQVNQKNNTTKSHLVKIMKRFVVAISNYYEMELDRDEISRIAKSSSFQKTIGEIATDACYKNKGDN